MWNLDEIVTRNMAPKQDCTVARQRELALYLQALEGRNAKAYFDECRRIAEARRRLAAINPNSFAEENSEGLDVDYGCEVEDIVAIEFDREASQTTESC